MFDDLNQWAVEWCAVCGVLQQKKRENPNNLLVVYKAVDNIVVILGKDNLFMVSGEKDHYKAARKAALASAQKTVMPVFDTMFSELQTQVNAHTVYHTNCRLPPHMKISYSTKRQQQRIQDKDVKVMGKDRFRYFAAPKPIAALTTVPTIQKSNQQTIETPRLISTAPVKEKQDKTVQTLYRDSSAQTLPYQTDYKVANRCTETPEVLHLDKLEVKIAGDGGSKCIVEDTAVEEVIRGRVRRAWLSNFSSATNPTILHQLAVADQLFREQQVEKHLLRKFAFEVPAVLQQSTCLKANTETDRVWTQASLRLRKTLDAIQHNKQREIRKLAVQYSPQAKDWKKRKGFVRNSGHILVNPEFLPNEEEFQFPQRGVDLKMKWRDAERRCKKEAKLDTKILTEMHEYFKGTCEQCSPTEVNLKNYSLPVTSPRRNTITYLRSERISHASGSLKHINAGESQFFEAALLLQRILKGRAVQTKIYEDLSRKCGLIHELVKSDCYIPKSTTSTENTETLPPAYEILKNQTTGRVLHLLNKELDLQMEVEKDIEILTTAENERCKREAAEAGRRQVEERRRREHDEMFSQIMLVMDQSLENTLKKIFSIIVAKEAHLSAEVEVQKLAEIKDEEDIQLSRNDNEMDTAEYIAEIIMNVVLPQTVKTLSEEEDRENS